MSAKTSLQNSEKFLQSLQNKKISNLSLNQNLQNQEEDLSHSINNNISQSQLISQNNFTKPFSNTNPFYRQLFLYKINLKDKSNSYYKKGVYNIFNNENYFLENKYDDKFVVINHKNKMTSDQEYIDINGKKILIRDLNFKKQRKFKQANLFDSYNNEVASTSKSDTMNKRFMRSTSFINENKYKEKDRESFVIYSDNQNSKQNEGKKDKLIFRNSLNRTRQSNLLGKRLPVFYLGQTNNLTDGELDVLYSKIHERVEKNHNKEILSRTLNRNKIKKISPDNMNKILTLQEKVLLDSKANNQASQKILKRVLKYSKKENKNLLINQSQNYRFQKEIRDETTIILRLVY